jgi:hypothetical protein
VLPYSTNAAVAPTVPASGPAMPIWACLSASWGCCRWKIAAPKNGMNRGAEAAMPCRRISTTWPISWTRIMTTRPAANQGPKKIA